MCIFLAGVCMGGDSSLIVRAQTHDPMKFRAAGGSTSVSRLMRSIRVARISVLAVPSIHSSNTILTAIDGVLLSFHSY